MERRVTRLLTSSAEPHSLQLGGAASSQSGQGKVSPEVVELSLITLLILTTVSVLLPRLGTTTFNEGISNSRT